MPKKKKKKINSKGVFDKYYSKDLTGRDSEETIKKAELFKGSDWGYQFRKALDPKTSEEEKASMNSEDALLRIALIWGVSESGQRSLFNYLANKYKESEDWATICSIVCSPFCSSEVLDYLSRGIAKEKGYGYILRVIARNRNVGTETLRNIAEDGNLEKRYKEVAIAGLNFGSLAANNQV